jgi:hypothetical protein
VSRTPGTPPKRSCTCSKRIHDESGKLACAEYFLQDVVWVVAGKIDNVEHVPGQGYRLKKR